VPCKCADELLPFVHAIAKPPDLMWTINSPAVKDSVRANAR
jgi:hypothetical protein